MSLHGSEPTRDQDSRTEEAYRQEVEAANSRQRNLRNESEEHMAKRLRAAADDQPHNAGQCASQLNDQGGMTASDLPCKMICREAVDEQAVPNRNALTPPGGEAHQRDMQGPVYRPLSAGQHAPQLMGMRRTEAVGRRAMPNSNAWTLLGGEIDPLAQESAPVWQRVQAQRRQRRLLEFAERMQREAERRATHVSMDTLDTRRWLLMQGAAPVAIAIAEELWVTRSPQVPGYNWHDSEPAQSERLIQHLDKIIGPCSGETEWVNAAKDYPELLSCNALGYNISATTDVLAADATALRAGKPQTGMRLLMDIKEAVAASDIRQGQARVLLGNLHSPESRPVLVVTDLNDVWHAMWLDGSTIYQHAFEYWGQAVGFIQDLLAGRHETCGDIAHVHFAKRRVISPRVLANYAHDAAFPLKVGEAIRKYRQAAESSPPAAPAADLMGIYLPA